MSRIASSFTDPAVPPPNSEPVVNLADVKALPPTRPKNSGTSGATGKAADLGRPSYRTDLQWAGGNGPTSSTSAVSVQQNVKVPLDQNTTATGAVRVLGYGGRNGVQGVQYRGAVGVNRTLTSAPGSKYTVDATAGVELRQQQRPTLSDNLSFDVALAGRGEWKTSPATTVFAELSAKQVLAGTNQGRGRAMLGAVYKPPGSDTAVTAWVAGEGRLNQNGPSAGRGSFFGTVGVDAAFGIGKGTQVIVGVSHTAGGPGSATTPSDNDGLAGKVQFRLEL